MRLAGAGNLLRLPCITHRSSSPTNVRLFNDDRARFLRGDLGVLCKKEVV